MDVEGRTVKFMSVLALILLAGFATGPTMDELETQAFISGDWTAVEKRERAVARRELRSGNLCPYGYIAYCEQRVIEQVCTCVDGEFMRSLFSGR